MRNICSVVVAAASILFAASPAVADRDWEFSFGAYGGKAFHANTTGKFNYLTTPAGFEAVDAKGHGIKFDDSGTFGAKLTAWRLPRRYDWQPQIGFELDWTSFTADRRPQTFRGEGFGKESGLTLGDITFSRRDDYGLNNLAINLLFRYPVWATPDMPQGRWYPYLGVGAGVQRAHLSIQQTTHQETSYGPCLQGLIGAKFFLIKYLSIFGEFKWTQGWQSFNLPGTGFPSDYRERYTFATGHLVGGVALHF